MRNLLFPAFITLAILSMLPVNKMSAAPGSRPEYFEIKVYHLASDSQLTVTDSFLRADYLPALHSAGFSNVGVFKPIGNDTAADKKIYVFIPFASIKQWEKFRSNAASGDAKGDASSYLSAPYNHPAYARMETIFLEAFEDMKELTAPKLETPKSERVYELRSYESAGENLFRNKLQMFNQGGEIKLFSRLGFNAVFYGEVLFGAKMPNLMYMTSFANMQSREEHWKTFSNDPEWKTLSALPEYQNNVSHIDITFLRSTDYSDL